jgi:hypothetical protein
MKKILSLTLLVLLFSCTTVNVPEPEPVDLAAEEVAIKAVFDSLFKSVDDRNIDLLASLFTDDGIFMGTDPTELFPKDTLVSMWAMMMQEPEIPPFEFINDPVIRIQPDGKSAVVVQQYYWKLFTTLPLRHSFGMVKKDSVWLIDFFDFSFIPYNEQIPVLNEAVSTEKE